MSYLQTDVRLVKGHVDGQPVLLRVKRSTGSTDPRVKRKMEDMLRTLWKQPKHRHLVEEIATGVRSLLDVFAADEARALDELAPPLEDREVPTLLDTWLATLAASAEHKHRIRQCFAQLCAGQRRTVRISDLSRLLTDYRAQCFTRGHARAFSYAKAAVLAFFRDNGVSPRHEYHVDVHLLSSFEGKDHSVEGLTISDARAVGERLAALSLHPHGAKQEDRSRGVEAAHVWEVLYKTGMNPKEFFGNAWTPLADRVVIKGTKRVGRRWGADGRAVPRLVSLVRTTLSQDWFARLLKQAGATPYQGRKTFARMLEDAGIPRTRRQLYLGHGARDITDLYERHEITAFLAEDTARLVAFLGEPVALQLVKEG